MTKVMYTYLFFMFLSCINVSEKEDDNEIMKIENKKKFADVMAVKVNGEENDYRFSVTLSSPDKGCDQYADWWEIITEGGSLIYRRVLLHSHDDEQPFTRSGNPVNITESQEVIIRGHMNNSGYGGATLKGSVKDGFIPWEQPEGFAENLKTVSPLPKDCAF